LCREFTREEVNITIHQMHSLKASGLDGFLALFYKKYWHVVGEDVTSFVLDIVINNANPSSIYNTFICLIPKVSKPKYPKQLRLICLCNVSMKIVTKCIANRLKTILSELVGITQSAFIPVRQITDNAFWVLKFSII